MRTRLVRACLVFAVIDVGCSSDAPKSGNGVDDVQQSCQIRATWNRTNNDCSLCEQAVKTARCDCSTLRDFSAACIDQQDARGTVCAASVDTCVRTCATTDCACIVACYTAGDACKKASDALDGCVVEACASYCK